jgi:ABC-type transporter Mla subunit MlaD
MSPVTIAMLVREGLKILKVGKDTFYPDKTINEAESLLKHEVAGNVESLQEQLESHRQVMDKLVEQARADKEMIEKHNEVLLRLAEAAEKTAQSFATLRILAYCSIAMSGLALLGLVLLATR